MTCFRGTRPPALRSLAMARRFQQAADARGGGRVARVDGTAPDLEGGIGVSAGEGGLPGAMHGLGLSGCLREAVPARCFVVGALSVEELGKHLGGLRVTSFRGG